MPTKKSWSVVGTVVVWVIGGVLVINVWLSTMQGVREQWQQSKTFLGFIYEVLLSGLFTVDVKPEVEFSNLVGSPLKQLGQEGARWIAIRREPYNTTEEFIRKSLRIAAVVEAIERTRLQCEERCKIARTVRSISRNQELVSTLDFAEESSRKYGRLMSVQRRQVENIGRWCKDWTDTSGELADAERIAREYELEIHQEFATLLDYMKSYMEKLGGEKIRFQDANPTDIGMIRR